MLSNSRPRQILFLEHWLRAAAAADASQTPSPAAAAPPPSAAVILRSWADLRDPSADPPRLLSALLTLSRGRSALHVSDPQAKLLLSLLPSSSPDAFPLVLSLLYTYLRKSSRPSPPLLLSILSVSSSFPPSTHSILLLGALSASPALPASALSPCLDHLCSFLDSSLPAIFRDADLLPEFLAGIGYALSRLEDDARLGKILNFLFRIWSAEAGGIRPSLSHGLMVLRLFEWCTSGFLASRSWSRIESLCGEISANRSKSRGNFAPLLVLMAPAGVLRAFRSNRVEIDPRLRKSIEESISYVAECTISRIGTDSGSNVSDDSHVLLQCIAIGLAQCGSISFNASVLRCLCLSLLNEVFPLQYFFRMSLENVNENSATCKAKEHLGSALFKEAGAVTGVFCNQYASADEVSKAMVENHLWDYSQEVYSNLRLAAWVHRGKSDELLGDLEKIAEAAFLMVVVFAAEVSKHKLNSKSSHEFRPEVSSRILVAFSCMEYLRRVRLPEYTEAVRRAVLTLQENADSCVSFVESIPPYTELTKAQGSIILERMRYIWSQDEVQTSRILFYLRVLPTCISFVPTSLFGKRVAPTMFLYMQHPNEKVTRASHSIFVSFVSSGKDSDQDDRVVLKEQLVFYYMQRALQVYPRITPFEGLASGVAALVRHLPAGSPAIFYCIHSLVAKASDLCGKAMSEDPTMWKNWEGSSGPPKKVLDLLLRLIYLVDIQMLPYLLKQLAEFIIQLPKDGQNALLDEMYFQVAESDDVTRKPVLVSWLQSLSFICSQKKASSTTEAAEKHGISVPNNDSLSWNRTSARL
ncbi:hypothetical protein C4D60_Mb01t13290 [Musa balbisiana]|uniref:Uncharacterized protein n=1 Tax=Musa balbisiana TaxID=52838 RepID=A0A4V4H7B4_MUSBA|nr:hypothetical protein C4D60_Mb01t13290 [Musa balbisiana]